MDCDHEWMIFPWYNLCAHCYETDVPVNDDWHYSDEQDIADPNRPWTVITTRDPIFMDIMRLQICPDCGSIVVEENYRRSDGTRAVGFTCVRCSSRWWVNDEERD